MLKKINLTSVEYNKPNSLWWENLKYECEQANKSTIYQ